MAPGSVAEVVAISERNWIQQETRELTQIKKD